MTDRPHTFVGLDMSGSETRCLIAAADGPILRYVASGSLPVVDGPLKAGRESRVTSKTVHEVLCRAEQDAGLSILSAVVGMGGFGVTSHLVHTAVAPAGRRRAIGMEDVRNVVRKAENGLLNPRSTVLQLVPLKFIAGEHDGAHPPIGVPARRLEAYVRVIAAGENEHDAVNWVVKNAGIRVEETLLGGFAAALETLALHETSAGVAHLDFGRTASCLTAFCNGGLRLAVGLPLGLDDLIADVARGFGTEPAIAAKLISQFGRVEFDLGQDRASVLVPGLDPSDPVGSGALRSCRLLNKIITRRVDDCLHLALAELHRANLGDEAIRTLVLSGDMAALPGIETMARVFVGIKTRVGVPNRVRGLPPALRHPGWACVSGLVLYAHRLAQQPSESETERSSAQATALRREEKAA